VICALLGYYAWSGDSIPTLWDNLAVPFSVVKKSNKTFFLDFSTREIEPDRMSQNISTELPFRAA